MQKTKITLLSLDNKIVEHELKLFQGNLPRMLLVRDEHDYKLYMYVGSNDSVPSFVETPLIDIRDPTRPWHDLEPMDPID